ncbi:hypothetical protein HZC07_01305 [Candidatus Micrarchaeota archaeon]|nr:hypothetical protein [Candidatus Micrarchaeota archaeon]
MIIGNMAKFSAEIDLVLLAKALEQQRLLQDDRQIGTKGFTKVELLGDATPYGIESIFRMRRTKLINDIDLVTGKANEVSIKTLSHPFVNFIIFKSGLIYITTKDINWKEFLCKIRDMYNKKLAETQLPPVDVGIDYGINEKLLRKLFYSSHVKKVIRVSIERIGEIPPNPIPGFDPENSYVIAVKDMGQEIDKLILHARKKVNKIKTDFIYKALISYSGVSAIKVELQDGSKITARKDGVCTIDKKKGEPETLFRLSEAFEEIKGEFATTRNFSKINKEYSF